MTVFSRMLVFAAALLLVLPAYAQNDESWSAYLYVDMYGQYGDVVQVNSQTLTDVNPGESADFNWYDMFGEGTYIMREVQLAPDNNTIVLTLESEASDADGLPLEGQGTFQLVWGTLSGGVYYPREVAPYINAIDLGDFSPDGKWFSYSWVGGGSAEGERTGGLVAFELLYDEFGETGFIQLPISQASAAIPELASGPWAVMGQWLENGIQFSPTCYACDAPEQGEYAVWEPFTGQISLSGGEQYDHSTVDVLSGTGEALALADDPAFAGAQAGSVPNVIRYAPTGDLSGTDARVIYHNPDPSSDLMAAHWVNDGRAVLVEFSTRDRWVVIERDGTVSTLDRTLGVRILAGSPEGWFTLVGDEEGATFIRHYNGLGSSSNEVSYIPGGDAQVIRMPDMGVGLLVSPSDFPAAKTD